jgi:aminoglycoside phosphotransferase (APT) family kinase protein
VCRSQVKHVYAGTSTTPVRVARSRGGGIESTFVLKRGARLREDGYRFNMKQVVSEYAAFAAYHALGTPVPSAALYDCVVSAGTEKCFPALLLTEFIEGEAVAPQNVEQLRIVAEREYSQTVGSAVRRL